MDEFVFPHRAVYLENSSEKLSDAGPGLTKRELFAVMIMQGLAVNNTGIGYCAKTAVEAADRLIKELSTNEFSIEKIEEGLIQETDGE